MSDENSELDEIDFNSEIESVETFSNASFSPPRPQDPNATNFELPTPSNVTKSLFLREIGFGCLKPIKHTLLRSYHLKNVFPKQVLLSHVFMGMTRCGRFLMTYTMIIDQDDDEWYATVYKYRLHWWAFKPGSQVRKVAEVSLFGNHKIATPLQIHICQWPQDYEKILVYGLMKECGNIDTTASQNNQHAFVTVTALPALNNCQDCRVVASSYKLDDIAASWDTCLRCSCLKHGYTVHTSFDVVVPYPEFVAKISLKCHDYAVFNTNNFLYAIRIKLENTERKMTKEDAEDLPYELKYSMENYERSVNEESPSPSCSKSLINEQNKASKIKEQIIRDFSEENNLPKGEETISITPNLGLMSPPLPTRITNFNIENRDKEAKNVNDSETESSEDKCSDKDCFRCPKSSVFLKASKTKKIEQKILRPENRECSKKNYKSFFTRHKVPKNNFNIMLIRKPILRPVELHRFGDKAENAYDFVDDTQNEVEKLSLFRKKRLADKKYEFQDCDSENIVPFSIVRQENTLRSPRKSTESENEEERAMPEDLDSENSNSRYLDLSVSVPSPRSPLILEILSSPTQHEGVLRPFNRNTNGTQLLSPMAKFLSSPTNAQKLNNKCIKSKGCDESKIKNCQQGACKNPTNMDTHLILENGILINDISERYFKDGFDCLDSEIYNNLFRNIHKFQGEAVRFERRFVEVDDELVSVITDIEDDDMSAVTGYHTALNVEVHGAGYAQLQMISNSKAEKISAPCVVIDQQTLDIEAICHSVATTLCLVSNKTFTFCNDYDVEVLDVCPRSGDVLVLLMMRIEGSEGMKEEGSQLEQYEASATLIWNLHSGDYKVCMVVPPQRANWVWDYKGVWNPAREAAKRFKKQLPADVTICDPEVRVCANISTFRGISLSRIQDFENGVQFLL